MYVHTYRIPNNDDGDSFGLDSCWTGNWKEKARTTNYARPMYLKRHYLR
jgi:hypothetical protein